MWFPALILMAAADDPAPSLSAKMLPIYQQEAREYTLAVESAPMRPLELKAEPVLEWTNPIRGTGGRQQGAVFIWLLDGRPAALGCIFSEPHTTLPGRLVRHELHALDPEKLLVSREAVNKWEPQAGLARAELADAGLPAATPGLRLVQMRQLAKEFTGYSAEVNPNGTGTGKRYDLRLLPTPLYRYKAAKTGVVDGALFALVSEAGTDPEVLLVIEAREEKGKLRWEFACGRFSDCELHVTRKEKEVFTSVRGPDNPFAHDPKHLYRIYPDKVVTEEGKLIARVRQTARGPEVTPVEEK
jgi:hypothetical protein